MSSTKHPTDEQFYAAVEASNKDVNDKLTAVEATFTEELDVKQHIRLLILSFLAAHCYDARLRVYLKRHYCRGNLVTVLYEVESSLFDELQTADNNDIHNNNRVLHLDQPFRPLSPSAILLTGMGAAVGGAAVAMTAGLAAPIVLPSVAALLGTGVLSGGAGVAAMATLFGAAGAAGAGLKVARHFKEIQGVSLHTVPPKHPSLQNSLAVNVCVSGWYTDRRDLPLHWAFVPPTAFVLEYEPALMESLGNVWEELAVSTVTGMAVTEALRTTVLGTALAAIAWPLTLLQIGSMIDHPWWLAVGRSRKCGMALAGLLAGERGSDGRPIQGARPVSLLGYSMGAIVVFYCLEELARIGAFGVVEDAVMLGLPVRLPPPDRLRRIRAIVAGRWIHGYSRRDWVLRFLFRTTRLHVGDVAGLVPLDIDGVESVDFTALVPNHTEYRDKLDEIIGLLNLH